MTPAIDLRPDHRKIVEDILREHLPDGVQVWVFGSRADWTTKESSDLDLALEGDGPLDPRAVMALDLAFEESLLPFSVDVVDLARVEDGFREIVEANRTPLAQGPVARHDWVQGVLADACDAIDYGLTAAASSDARGPKLLRITDIVTGHIDWSSVPFANVDDAKRAKYRLNDGDIVIARTGASTGSSTFVKAPPDAVFASYLVRLRARQGYDARFVAYFLKSEQFSSFLRGVLGDKSAQPNASASTMTAAPFRAPRNRAEQRAIGGVLGALDDKIELNRRMNATLEAMARALFKSWFVDFDPVRAKMEGRDTGLPPDIAALFPDRLVKSELGQIPEGWEALPLRRCFRLTMGQSPPGYTYNDTGIGLPFFQGRTDFGFRFPRRRRFCSEPARAAESGDTIASVRAPVGDINMASERCCIGRGLAALRHRSKSISYTYYAILRLQPALRDFEGTGTVFGAITKNQFEEVCVLEPPSDVVREFDALVSALDDQIRVNDRGGQRLASLRDALLPKLVSGDVRLPAAVIDRYAKRSGPTVA